MWYVSTNNYLATTLQVEVTQRTTYSLLTGTDSQAKEQAADLCDKLCDMYCNGTATYDDDQPYDQLRFGMLITAMEGGLPGLPSEKVSC